MQSVNFEILRQQRPALAELGGFAEHYLHSDPASSLTKLRIYGEQITKTIPKPAATKPETDAAREALEARLAALVAERDALKQAYEAQAAQPDTQAKGQQAANALEKQYGLRPAIFTTNGYDIWLWGDAGGYPERKVFGFSSKDSLQHLVRFKRFAKEPLNTLSVNPAIAGSTLFSSHSQRAFRGEL